MARSTRILDTDPEGVEEDIKDDLTPREARRTRKRVLSASEVHPLPTFRHDVETDGSQPSERQPSEISTEVRSFKMRELHRVEDELEMAELEYLAEQRKHALEEIRAKNRALLPASATPQETFKAESQSGKSFLSDPEVVRMVAGMPSDKQAQFFQSIAAAEMAERNPQMAIFNSLLQTYQKMTPQQAQQVDPIKLVTEITNLQKTLRESDPMYQQMLRYADEQRQFSGRLPQSDPNSLSGILEKKLVDKIANTTIEELFGGAKPTQQPTGGAPPIDTGVGLFLDEETGQYMPKVVTYPQYLEVTAARNARLHELDEIKLKEDQMKQLTSLVEPLIPRMLPIVDAVVTKASDTIISTPLQKQATAAAVSKPVVPPGVPAPPGPAPESIVLPQPEQFECMNCHNKWLIYPDARGKWASMIQCEKCSAVYTINQPSSPPTGAPPPKPDRPDHSEEYGQQEGQ